MFITRKLIGTYHETQREVNVAFIDLKKIYVRVPTQEAWNCKRVKCVTVVRPYLFDILMGVMTVNIKCAKTLNKMYEVICEYLRARLKIE